MPNSKIVISKIVLWSRAMHSEGVPTEPPKPRELLVVVIVWALAVAAGAVIYFIFVSGA